MSALRPALRAALAAALLAGGALASPSGPGGESLDPDAALAAAAAGRCEEALPLLARARAADPGALAIGLAEAQCRMRLRRYDEAREVLTVLRDAGHAAPEMDLYLGIAHYHTGDLEGARRELAQARVGLPDRAETHLYWGIVALEAGEPAEALPALERARELDAARVDPMASYYAGIARARRGDREGAVRELERVVAGDAGGAWAGRASRAMARLEEPAERPAWRLALTAGLESDDNVLLRGEDETLPEEISDESDERVTWRVRGSTPLLPLASGDLGVSADYVGTAHHRVEGFDVHYPTASLWWQRRLGERTATRVETRVGLARVEGSSFFTHLAAGPALVHTWPGAGRTTARARAIRYDYRHRPADVPDGNGVAGDPCPPTTPTGATCGTPGVDESRRRHRSGEGVELYAGHAWRVPGLERDVTLEPGMLFLQYFARGDEASFMRFEPRLSIAWELPFALRAQTRASFSYRPYAGSTSLPEPGTASSGLQYQPARRKRRDRITRVGLSLERTFLRGVVLEARYTFSDNASNLALAEYTRHIVGGYLSVRLGDPR